jgi:hypothetical protein
MPTELEQMLEICKILPDRSEWIYMVRVKNASHFKVGHFKVNHARGRRCIMDRYARRTTTPNLPSDFHGIFAPQFLTCVKMIRGTVALERAIHSELRSRSQQRGLRIGRRTEFHHCHTLQDAMAINKFWNDIETLRDAFEQAAR